MWGPAETLDHLERAAVPRFLSDCRYAKGRFALTARRRPQGRDQRRRRSSAHHQGSTHEHSPRLRALTAELRLSAAGLRLSAAGLRRSAAGLRRSTTGLRPTARDAAAGAAAEEADLQACLVL